jgi:hypothetical protein
MKLSIMKFINFVRKREGRKRNRICLARKWWKGKSLERGVKWQKDRASLERYPALGK